MLGEGAFPRAMLCYGARVFLPSVYQGMRINDAGPPIDNLFRFRDQTPKLQRRMLDVLQRLNREHQERYAGETELAARIESFELAFRMQTSAPETFDISRESPETQRLYGLDNDQSADFGRQCLIARRLVEQGVRFVQIYSGGNDNAKSWDAHADLRGKSLRFRSRGGSTHSRALDRPQGSGPCSIRR